MKKIITFVILFLGVLCSCEEDHGAYYPVPTEFTVSPTSFTINPDGGDIEITINGGNLGWWIETSDSWVSVTKKYGSGNATIKISVAKNLTGEPRQTTVVVNPTFNQPSVSVIITQTA